MPVLAPALRVCAQLSAGPSSAPGRVATSAAPLRAGSAAPRRRIVHTEATTPGEDAPGTGVLLSAFQHCDCFVLGRHLEAGQHELHPPASGLPGATEALVMPPPAPVPVL